MADQEQDIGSLKDDNITTKQNEDLSPYMSEAERAALGLEEDDTVTLKDVLADLKPGADEPALDDDEPGVTDDDAQQQAAQQATQQAANQPAAQTVTDPGDEPPPITAQAVENLDTQLAELEAQRAKVREDQITAEEALREKLEMADIEPDEFKKQMAALRAKADADVEAVAEKRRDLADQQRSYERQVADQGEFYKRKWMSDSKRFVDEVKATGIDYADPARPLLTTALNAEVARLNREQPDLSNRELLVKAHEAVVKQLNLTPAKPMRSSAKREIPPNLGAMPSSMNIEANPETNAKFAKAERASGFELERIVASMSEDEIDAYLRAD